MIKRRLGRGGAAAQAARPAQGAERVVATRASMAQERLALVQSLAPHSPFYNAFRTWRISGPLDMERLRAALAQFTGRHDLVRSRMRWTEHGLKIQRGGESAVPLRSVDFSGLSESFREAAAQEEVEREIRMPFDLEAGPLMRVLICRLDPLTHVLAINLHHVACDGWSFGLIHRELAESYARLATGEECAPVPMPMSYANYAQWQRSRWQERSQSPFADYWRRRLGGELPTLNLPVDFRRPRAQRFRGDRVLLSLSPTLAADLDRFALQERTTRFVVLMAAFQCLLHRYSGQQTVLVGTPVANRDRVELQDVVGLIVNTLVVRCDFCGDPTFQQFLGHLKHHWLEDYARADTPLEWLMDTLNCDRSADRMPLFQALFVLQNTPDLDLSFRGLQVEHYHYSSAVMPSKGNGTSKFDLTLSLRLCAGRLEGFLEYDTDLFSDSTVECMAEQFAVLLEGAIGEPGLPLSQLPMSTPERRDSLRALSQGARGHYPRDAAIHRAFESVAARRPEADALTWSGGTLSYGALNANANQLARWLRARYPGEGHRVAVLMDRCELAVIAILGILKAGAAYVPLNPDDPPERLLRIVSDARVDCVLATTGTPLDERALPAPLHCLDGPGADWRSADAHDLGVSVTGEEPAYVMFTSGSTGAPKGVVVPHRAVLRLVLGTDYLPFACDETFLLLAPLSFDASTFELWGGLLNGARCAIYADRILDTERLASVVHTQRVTTLWLTSSLFNLIVDTDPSVLRDIRHVVTGGEALSVEHVGRALDALPETRLYNGYGPTESTTFTTVFRVPGDLPRDAPNVPIGRPIANTSVLLVDARCQPVGVGVPGEIWVGGDGLAVGYLDDVDLTEQSFVVMPGWDGAPARWYRTGDWARWRPDGQIEFLGRRDRQLKLRGFRVEPEEVESMLRSHPAVRDCAVLEEAIGQREARLIGFYVPRDNAAGGNQAALRRALSAQLPAYLVPSEFVAVPALPVNANGKLDRGALRAMRTPREIGAGDDARVPGELENTLMGLWREVLGRNDIDSHTSLFDLGANSLVAMGLVTRMRDRLGVPCQLGTLLERPTIAEFAAHLMSHGIEETRAEIDSAGSGSECVEAANRSAPVSSEQRTAGELKDG